MNRGFTLLEVLLALAVIALVMTVGLVAVRGTAQRIGQVELTLGAEWALENVRQELLLSGTPPTSAQEREEEILGQVFLTRVEPLAPGRLSLGTRERGHPQALLAEATLEMRDARPRER